MCGRAGIGLSQRRKDVHSALLAFLALLLWVLPWVWYGGACLRGQRGAALAAAGPVEGRYVALTFDDGPRRETTALLLDGLARRGVHATFFIVGTRVEGREELLLRMAREGHQIGLHTQNHKVLSQLSRAELAQEVDALADTLTGLLGQREFMLRPPYGMTSRTLLKWAGHPVILWSVDPEDWSDRDTQRQTAVILDGVEDGSIILLHDIYPASVDTALTVVDELMARGYKFVTVEELFALRGVEPQDGEEYRKLPPSSG